MSSDRIKVRAKTNWRKSLDHDLHRRGEEFEAPAEWLPDAHLEVVNVARGTDEEHDGDVEAVARPESDR